MNASPPRPRDAARLDQLVAMLRCPETGQPLTVRSPRELVTGDGCRRWPVIDGRPCLVPGQDKPVDHGDHLSHPLCPEARAVIDRAAGPVLNLSAGGTHHWHPQVIEVETGIFRNTDLVADVHRLPFADASFDAVLALNAFEHYRDPFRAAREIARVLRPGGQLFIQTAFLQPLHESPWHYYNATRFGVLEWFGDFRTERLEVSENFNPVHTISWIAAETARMVSAHLPAGEVSRLLETPLREYARLWSDSSRQESPVWQAFFQVPVDAQEPLAAGFQYLGRRRGLAPGRDPDAEPS